MGRDCPRLRDCRPSYRAHGSGLYPVASGNQPQNHVAVALARPEQRAQLVDRLGRASDAPNCTRALTPA